MVDKCCRYPSYWRTDFRFEGENCGRRASYAHVSMPDYNAYRRAFHGVPMPFAFVDLDLLKFNIRQTVIRARGKRIRIASKSIRSVPLIELILASNPAFQGIMCFTAPEAVWL